MVSSTVSVSLIPLSALRSRHLPNGKRYAGQLPAVEPIIGLDDVAGVEQLVDPEVDRLLGSAPIPEVLDEVLSRDVVTLSAAFSDELDNRRTERLASQLTLTIVTVDVGWRGLGACVTDTTLYLRGDILARRKRRASLPQRGTRSSGSVSRLALPASMGRVSTLGRERLVALSRALPSESVSSRSIFNRPLSPNRSNLAVLCRHGSHLVGQRPSTGLPARRKHGWSAAHIPRSFAMGCGVTLSKHTFADDLAVSVGVPAVPLAAVASRNGRDSRPP